MRFWKKNMLSVNDMIEVENWLVEKCIPVIGRDVTEEVVTDKLKLKIEYTSQDEDNLGQYIEAELRPISDSQFNGLIRVSSDLKGKRFAFLHEIMHYLIDVGVGKKVVDVFTRKEKGHTENEHEQRINYATAAYSMPYNDVECRIRQYDQSHPKMDEVRFVNQLCLDYSQSKDAVIRRIQEVRQIKRRKEHKH